MVLTGVTMIEHMFERFTDRARTVVVLAQEEARSLSHNYIGTEHLLLGLLAEGNGGRGEGPGGGGRSRYEVARADVVRIVGPVAEAPERQHPIHAEGQDGARALRCVRRCSLGHDHIGTEHILLGIVDEARRAREPDSRRRTASRPRSPAPPSSSRSASTECALSVGRLAGRCGRSVKASRASRTRRRRWSRSTCGHASSPGTSPISSGHILTAVVARPREPGRARVGVRSG